MEYSKTVQRNQKIRNKFTLGITKLKYDSVFNTPHLKESCIDKDYIKEINCQRFPKLSTEKSRIIGKSKTHCRCSWAPCICIG